MIDFILSQPNQSIQTKGMFIEDVYKTTSIQKTTIDICIQSGKDPKKSATCKESKGIIEKIYSELKEKHIN